MINPFQPYVSISNGNLYVSGTSTANDGFIGSTFSVKTGKWYWEYTSSAYDTSGYSFVGVNPPDTIIIANGYTGYYPNSVGYAGNGNLNKYGGNTSNWGSTWGAGDVIGVALDCDNGAVYFSKNNTWQNSGSPTSGTSKTGAALTWTGGAVELTPVMDMYKSGNNGNLNFGQRPFAYTAPSGFKALCTTNLPTPTIQKPSSYMDVVTYTGTGLSRSITGLGFSPDLVWIKGRSNISSHRLADTVRGAGKELFSNETSAELTNDAGGYVSAFNSDGFSLETGAGVNNNTWTYVAWAWDEAPIAGMDIVGYTGNNNSSTTISHSLGVTPSMIIVKPRSGSYGTEGWQVWHKSLSASNVLQLHSTAAQAGTGTFTSGIISSSPTSSAFGFTAGSGGVLNVNASSTTYIAYLFAEVEGFSKFGSYTGNGSADGPFVWCGFRPRWVMVKVALGATADWIIRDTQRNQFNLVTNFLAPSDLSGEATGYDMDICSNGFKVRNVADSGTNGNGYTYIFAAFAESPFKYARAR